MILQTQYSASKHAVKAFTDGLRMELESQGAPIAVTLIKPSSIDTPYVEHARNYLDRGDRRSAAGLRSASRRQGDRVRGRAPAARAHRRASAAGSSAPWARSRPRLVDKAMEWTGYGSQTTDQPERPRHARQPLSGAGGWRHATRPCPASRARPACCSRRSSIPSSSAAILAGIAAGVAALFVAAADGRSPAAQRRARRRPVPRYQPHHAAQRQRPRQAHPGPGHVSQRSAREGRPQPRH